MKTKLMILTTIVVIFMVACGTNTDLPPEPTAPGVVGQATSIMASYAPANNNFVINPNPISYVSGIPNVNINVKNYQYIYNKGFILDNNNNWVKFDLIGKNSVKNWIKNDASFTNTWKESFFGDNTAVLIYACNWDDSIKNWDCNDNKFIVRQVPVQRPPQNSCSDTDGDNFNVKGTVTAFNNNQEFVRTDSCIPNSVGVANMRVKEYICKNNGLSNNYYDCPYGCYDGACKSAPSCTNNNDCKEGLCSAGICKLMNCSDSDGFDISVKGLIVMERESGTPYRNYDRCIGTDLYEYSCNLNFKGVNGTLVTCPYGQVCNDGKCSDVNIPLEPVVPAPAEPENIGLRIKLDLGYNFVNFPYDGMTVVDVKNKLGSGSNFQVMDNEGKLYTPQDTQVFDRLSGFYVQMLQNKEISFDQKPLDLGGIKLCPGSNLVGVDSCDGVPIKDIILNSQGKYIYQISYMTPKIIKTTNWLDNTPYFYGNNINLTKGKAYVFSTHKEGILTCVNGVSNFVEMEIPLNYC